VGAVLPVVDVERIRVPAERDAYVALEREERGAMSSHVAQDVTAKRRAILSNALLLTETMAPDAYDAAREALAALGVEDRVELFQSGGNGVDTARLVLYGHPIGVEFIGGYLDSLDRGGLLAVLGHEIGHALAHSGHPEFGWALPTCTRGNSPAKRSYSMAAELTADRFGLLACRDLDAVLRLEMRMSAGRAVKSIRFDSEAYLAQCRAVAEATMAGGEIAMGSTHPEHYIRGYAEWLFSETDLYRSITGTGSGSRSLDEVNAILERLISLPVRHVVSTTIAKPAPRAQPATPAVSTKAVVGEREDESAAKRSFQRASLEDVATDILTESARRKLAATRNALATLARGAVPSLRRVADAARQQFASSEERPAVPEDTSDPIEDERRELIARFEELERRSTKE
jgi:hypothetical protein